MHSDTPFYRWILIAVLSVMALPASAAEEYDEVTLYIGESLWPCFAKSYYLESREILTFTDEGYYRVVVVDDAQSDISPKPYKAACQDSYETIQRRDYPMGHWEAALFMFHPVLVEEIVTEISVLATTDGDPIVPVSQTASAIEALIVVLRTCEQDFLSSVFLESCDPSRFIPSISRLTDILEGALADFASKNPESGVMAHFSPKVLEYRAVAARE